MRSNPNLSDKQNEYLDKATRRWNIKTGATRSGKTFLDYAVVIPKRIINCTGNGLIVLLGNTQGTLNRNVLEPMRSLYGDSLVGEIKKGDNTAMLFGRKVYVLGADKVTSASKIQGAGIEYCYGDEVATWSETMFQMLKSRLDKPNSRFDGTCNPDNPMHWFKRFLDQKGIDLYHQHYTIDDNPYLDPAFVENLKREYAGTIYYDRYILGQWVRAEGVIYQNFHESRHVTSDVPHIRAISYAVDVGHSNATVFLAIGEGSDGRLYVLDEYYHSGRSDGRTRAPSEYARQFITFRDGIRQQHPLARRGPVCIDPSALGFTAELNRNGEIKTMAAKNDVLEGIQAVASMIERDKVRVHPRCKNFLEEITMYSWDSKAAERGEDKPIKENDHAMDAFRYAVYTLYTHGKARVRKKADVGIY